VKRTRTTQAAAATSKESGRDFWHPHGLGLLIDCEMYMNYDKVSCSIQKDELLWCPKQGPPPFSFSTAQCALQEDTKNTLPVDIILTLSRIQVHTWKR